MTEGTILAWSKNVGDPVAADESLCEIDTDKIVTDIPSPATGTLSEICVPVGKTVAVGTVLARIATGGATPEATSADRAGGGEDARPRADRRVVAHPEPTGPARSSAWQSPVVQRIAAEHGVDLAAIEGTGRGGRVRKQDVLAAVEARQAPLTVEPLLHIESPYRPEEGPTLSRMRRAIGEHMKRSLETAATCTTWMEADMTRVEAARRDAKASGLLGVTALPIVAWCAIDALAEHPALNAELIGERYTRHRAVHLGVAVSLGEDGLIVPVIRDAQTLSVEELGIAIRDLARRARSNTLTPDEVHGGTFTITNPGQFGSLMATPVINQPQVAILDLEAIVKRPLVVSGQDGEDVIAIRSQTILGMSWDHRALDGAQAAQYLAAVRRRLEGWDG